MEAVLEALMTIIERLAHEAARHFFLALVNTLALVVFGLLYAIAIPCVLWKTATG